jgi:hypothetical protein
MIFSKASFSIMMMKTWLKAGMPALTCGVGDGPGVVVTDGLAVAAVLGRCTIGR